MKAAWRIASLYLYRLVHRPATVLFLMAVPFTLAALEYAVFGPSQAPVPAPPTRIATVDQDETSLSGELTACLKKALPAEEIGVQPFPSVAEGKRAFRDGGYGALVIIPRDFEKHIAAGRPAAVEFYAGADSGAAVAENLLETCTNVQMSALARPDASRESSPFQDVSVRRAAQAESSPTLSSSAFFAAILPGLAIFGVLFLSQTMAGILWRDRHSVSQLRLWCMPIGGWTIALGELLYMTVGILAALIAMGALAHYVLRIDFHALPIVLLIAAGLSLCAAGAQVVLGALTKSERGAQGISSVAILLLSLLGGVFVPIDQYPGALRWLAHALPNGAALAGIGAAMNAGSNSEAVLPLVTVWAWAAILGAAGLFAGSRRARA